MIQNNHINIPSEEDFPEWLLRNTEIEIASRHLNHYNTAIVQMEKQLLGSSFWKLLCENLNEYNDEYYGEHNNNLLKERKPPVLETKPLASFLNKVYRKNVIDNKVFPEEPKSGWITPTNWFSEIDDILRTTIVVQYLDGVEYLASRLEAFCSRKSNLMNKCRYIARMDGYYAAHLYFGMEFEIPKIEWETQRISTSIEIQVTTQVKEVIKSLLHFHYENRRITRSSDEDIWQWKYDSPEFATNYLGHIIHYIEGMIVGIRKGK